MNKEELLKTITDFYLNSKDFNGLPLTSVVEDGKSDEIIRILSELVLEKKVSIVYGDGHPNSHIRALPEYHSSEKQVELLKSDMVEYACLYPLPTHLKTVVDIEKNSAQPYKLELMLGEPALSHRAFDLSILETYRDDPRYSYQTDDVSGSISIHSSHYEDGSMREEDKVFLQSFGFAYDESRNKYAAAFIWDLFRLTPEHQRLWKSKEISKKTILHPDFFGSQVLGQWPEHISIYRAFIEELQVVNQMAIAMKRPPLFRNDYKERDLPKGFSSLLRPTTKEYYDFLLLLDQLISDNINLDFFKKEISLDGKGSIRVLEEWTNLHFRPKDPAPRIEMFKTFREIRKLRSKPAHIPSENKFDQKYIHDQRVIILDAYKAIRTLRLMFTNHPATKSINISEELREGKIWKM